MNVLVGDLGGTKTILARVSEETGPRIMYNERTFVSADYKSLEGIIDDYLKDSVQKVDRACLAVAGPITKGRASITNLSWVVDSENLRTKYNFESIKLINDLEAVAYAIPVLEKDDLYSLQDGEAVEGGNAAIIAPGTGLGEAFLTGYGTTNQAHASEGSHVSFGPTNEIQMDLFRYMRDEKGFDHISYERVCSGALGIPNLYDFLKDTGREIEPEWLAEILENNDDPTPIIVSYAMDSKQPCKICESALGLFCDILAAEAGNLALKVLSNSGIYIGGGIPQRILDFLKKPQFLETLKNKGRFANILAEMPVKVILNSKAGLLGAAACYLK